MQEDPTLPDQRSTALPAPIALAATWSPEQAHGVLTCVKHYLANNQEFQRSTVDVQVDERTLQELYLPPFAMAIWEGGATSVMGSYNRINETYVCENAEILTHILRGQLGFRGFVMSDYRANPSTVQSAMAGLDWELGPKMWETLLLEAVQTGEVPPSTLDEMVRRILRPVVGLGLAVTPSAAGETDIVQVKFELVNTGAHAGTEVAQVYIAPTAIGGVAAAGRLGLRTPGAG